LVEWAAEFRAVWVFPKFPNNPADASLYIIPVIFNDNRVYPVFCNIFQGRNCCRPGQDLIAPDR